MNNIAAFSQTYGNDRGIIFDYRIRDKNLLKFINSFDMNVLSFHNSSKEFQDKIIQYNFYKEYISLNDISYSQSLLHNLLGLKSRGINKVFFHQDDVFSTQKNEEYYAQMFNFIKYESFDMICFENETQKEFNHINLCPDLKLFATNIGEVYLNAMNYDAAPYYSMNDGTYCADIDYLLNCIFDEQYFNTGSVFDCEIYLQHKHNSIISYNLPRMILNKKLFKRMSLVGTASILLKENDIKEIEDIFA